MVGMMLEFSHRGSAIPTVQRLHWIHWRWRWCYYSQLSSWFMVGGRMNVIYCNDRIWQHDNEPRYNSLLVGCQNKLLTQNPAKSKEKKLSTLFEHTCLLMVLKITRATLRDFTTENRLEEKKKETHTRMRAGLLCQKSGKADWWFFYRNQSKKEQGPKLHTIQ